MNENTGNSGNEFFYDLLDNPADLSHSNAFNLQLLINDYPQSGLLRAMLAVKREEESIKSASAYVNPQILYKVAHAIGSLQTVAEEQVVFCEKPQQGKPLPPLPGTVELPNLAVDESNYFHVPIDPDLIYSADETDVDIALVEDDLHEESIDGEAENDVVLGEDISQHTEDDAPVADEHEAEVDEEITPSPEIDSEATNESQTQVEEEVAPSPETESDAVNESEGDIAPPPNAEETEELEAPVETEAADEQEPPAVELEEPAAVETEETNDDILALEEEVDAESATIPEDKEIDTADEPAQSTVAAQEDSIAGNKPTQIHQEIDDEVFEEIVSIEDIGLEQLALMGRVTVTDEAMVEVTSPEPETEEVPAGDSYFVFEPTLPEDEEVPNQTAIVAQGAAGGQRGQNLSKYNDEKMPYSFMWWLDKTRKEHAAIYQPFVVEGRFHTTTVNPAEKPQTATDHLQQQYVENIFAVSAAVSDLNVAPPKADAPPTDTKADKIIEKFIHEEPQIKHPSKVKLDNENKAKKSSEDRDELVTETLAKIYTEQMLYHKAILTYKKLMLKFPEKSLYFAGQIEQLENKIN